MTGRRFAGALVAAGLLTLSGCARNEADRLVASLREHPGRAPLPLGADEKVVLIELEVGPSGIVPVGKPIAQPGSGLELELELAKRRTAAPPYWIVLSSADGARVRYWAAFSGQTRVHTTDSTGGRETAMVKRVEGQLASVRLPFIPGGRIEVFETAGRRRASFRFGTDAAMPIAGSVAASEEERGCPQVWSIHGNGGPGNEFGILFMSDGFTEADLPVYRCAVAKMTEALAKRHPYEGIAHAINVYRMDLVTASSGIEVPAACPQGDPPPFGPYTATPDAKTLLAECAGDPLMEGTALVAPGDVCEDCARTPLGFFNDPDVTPDCRVVWARQTGFRRVWSLTRCAPDVDIVIVVANSIAHAGAGASDSAPPIAVTTLWNVGTAGWHGRLVAHELGHALGLLDEYPEPTEEPPEYQSGRNVVRRLPDGSLEPIPWAGLCADATGAPASPCGVVAGPSSICGGQPPAEQVDPQVGLIEGAFYRPCGYYRSQGACLYNNAEEHSLCAGCRVYLRKLFLDLGLLRPDGSPP